MAARGSQEIPMRSELGQKRRFDRRSVTSGLPRSTDIRKVRRHVSNVPSAEERGLLGTAERALPLPVFCFTLWGPAPHATISACFRAVVARMERPRAVAKSPDTDPGLRIAARCSVRATSRAPPHVASASSRSTSPSGAITMASWPALISIIFHPAALIQLRLASSGL
jgi:hypothetical protein